MTTKVKRGKYDKQNPKVHELKFRCNKTMFARIVQLCSFYEINYSELIRIAITEKYMREFNNTNAAKELERIEGIIDYVESKKQHQ